MAHVGKWVASVTREEVPDHNRYIVDITAHGNDDPAARVTADIYTPTTAVTDVQLQRLQTDAVKDVPDAELLKLAEIAVNELPGLPMYVLFPGAAVQP